MSRRVNVPSPVAPAVLRRRLLRWFAANKSPYPWRRAVTPYKVWISEVMLQQTVTTAVAPRFVRWLQRFPNVRALAQASGQQVLREWEGLGYYARARNLHRAAQIIVREYRGNIPADYRQLLALPGIGNYTAAAIASIAFGHVHPVLDANVRRVMQRVLATAQGQDSDDEAIAAFLRSAISRRRPGDFNEALMELGQTVCRPRKPKCGNCPLQTNCDAYRLGSLEERSHLKTGQLIRRQSVLLIVCCKGKILLEQKQSGLFRNMWGFPRTALHDDADAAIAAWARKHVGTPLEIIEHLTPVTHFYTRHAEELYPVLARVSSHRKATTELRWLMRGELEEIPLPSVERRVWMKLSARDKRG